MSRSAERRASARCSRTKPDKPCRGRGVPGRRRATFSTPRKRPPREWVGGAPGRRVMEVDKIGQNRARAEGGTRVAASQLRPRPAPAVALAADEAEPFVRSRSHPASSRKHCGTQVPVGAAVDVADAVWRNGDSCRGVIDRRAQVNPRKLLRSDTPLAQSSFGTMTVTTGLPLSPGPPSASSLTSGGVSSQLSSTTRAPNRTPVPPSLRTIDSPERGRGPAGPASPTAAPVWSAQQAAERRGHAPHGVGTRRHLAVGARSSRPRRAPRQLLYRLASSKYLLVVWHHSEGAIAPLSISLPQFHE